MRSAFSFPRLPSSTYSSISDGVTSKNRLASAQQLLEHAGFATDRVRVQPNRLPICKQRRFGRDVRRLEEAPQRRERLARAIAPDTQLDAGPQDLDHLLARMPPLQIQREQRERRRDRATRKLCKDGVTARRAQADKTTTLP